MQATNERVEKFKAEAAQLNLKAGNANQDAKLQSLGTLLMVAGVVVARFILDLAGLHIQLVGQQFEGGAHVGFNRVGVQIDVRLLRGACGLALSFYA